jgi:hypothetical protein
MFGDFFSTSNSSKAKYEEIDPYKSWRESGLAGGYGAGMSGLMEELRNATNPTSSPAFRFGREAIEAQTRENRRAMIGSLIGRGNAFGGQARRASADLAAGENKALSDLVARLSMNRPQIAQIIAQLSGGMLRAPMWRTKSQTQTQGMPEYEQLTKSLELGGEAAGAAMKALEFLF